MAHALHMLPIMHTQGKQEVAKMAAQMKAMEAQLRKLMTEMEERGDAQDVEVLRSLEHTASDLFRARINAQSALRKAGAHGILAAVGL